MTTPTNPSAQQAQLTPTPAAMRAATEPSQSARRTALQAGQIITATLLSTHARKVTAEQLPGELEAATNEVALLIDRETAALRASHAEMLAALKALLGDEWRMSCDWGPASEREPITDAARAAIANAEACK